MINKEVINNISTKFVETVYRDKNMVDYYTNLVENVGLFKCEQIFFQKYIDIGEEILDVGCGAGRITIALYNMGFTNITGLDISEAMIESARRLNKNIEFVKGDATKLEYKNESFEKVIFSFNGLMLIPKLENRLMAFKEIQRVLKKDGYFIFSTPFLDNKIYMEFWRNEIAKWQNNDRDNRLYEFGDLLMEDMGVEEIFIHIPYISEIQECLIKTGFELIQCIPRMDICIESEIIEEQLDDGLFWVVKKV